MVILKQPLERRADIVSIPLRKEKLGMEQYRHTRANNPILATISRIIGTIGQAHISRKRGHRVTKAINKKL